MISPLTPESSGTGPYSPRFGLFDECVDPQGSLRPHWTALFKGINDLGPGELQRRWEQAQRQVTRDGFTYNPYEEGTGNTRPWLLEALPLLIQEQEWKQIEEGLSQRARLFNLILKDLLGKQNLLRDKHLPPGTLFGNPAYYPAYHGLHEDEESFLHLYAADLARSPDGLWWVVADRTRAPFGLGYVLENRIVASRMLPSLFRGQNVQRLASFFIALKKSLRERARGSEHPRTVIWTKGPQSRAYFEDAYLARYLGLQLVEGGDLAVRGNRVMIKTLGGLLPVEVIYRRLDEDDCDPVELNGYSQGGVAGLLEVLRSGNLVMANPLGSRLVESPLFMAFLPSLCEILLDEPLKMPSVATWWCGEKAEMNYVIQHLDELIIRKAYRLGDEPPVRPALLSRAGKKALIDKIRNRPQDFVGQETVARSTTPVWEDGKIEPWSLAIRSFLVRDDDGYISLPGGLSRVANDDLVLDRRVSSNERRQDIWVIGDQPIEEVTLLSRPGELVKLRRSGSELPSRVADNLFWLGRSVERAESSARLMRTVLSLMSGENESKPEVRHLLKALAAQGQIAPDHAIPELEKPLPSIDEVLPQAIFDHELPKSLASTIREAFRLISIVRDRMSLDAWRIIHRIADASEKGPKESPDSLEYLDRVILDLVAFTGLTAESMTRTLGWRFLDMGLRIERASQTSLLLRSTLVEQQDDIQPILEAMLSTADSIMTYRSRYFETMQIHPVLDLLITDESNPRSIAYQLVAIADHVNKLPRDDQQAQLTTEQRQSLSLLNSVRLADVHDLAILSKNLQRESLDKLMSRIIDQLPLLADAMSSRFLIHAGLPRHFASSTARQS